jgi:toxin ParE1/3/4
MSVSLVVSDFATEDINRIHTDLDAKRSGLGGEFISELRRLFEFIQYMPTIYGKVYDNVRAAKLHRFRYVLYYHITPSRIEVIAIVHGSQQESVWRDRLEG